MDLEEAEAVLEAALDGSVRDYIMALEAVTDAARRRAAGAEVERDLWAARAADAAERRASGVDEQRVAALLARLIVDGEFSAVEVERVVGEVLDLRVGGQITPGGNPLVRAFVSEQVRRLLR